MRRSSESHSAGLASATWEARIAAGTRTRWPDALRPGLVCILASLCLTGCTFVSSDGPNRNEVRADATVITAPSPPVGFVVLDLNASVLRAANGNTEAMGPGYPRT